jgi:hypothetical protein
VSLRSSAFGRSAKRSSLKARRDHVRDPWRIEERQPLPEREEPQLAEDDHSGFRQDVMSGES